MGKAFLECGRQGHVSTVRFGLSRIVDGPELDAIREELVQFVIMAEPAKVLLSLDGVDLISSAAVTLLRDLYRAVQSRHGELRLCSVRPEIADVLRFTKMDSLFAVYPDLQTALSDFE